MIAVVLDSSPAGGIIGAFTIHPNHHRRRRTTFLSSRQSRCLVSRSCSYLETINAAAAPKATAVLAVSGHHGIDRGAITWRSSGMMTPPTKTAFA